MFWCTNKHTHPSISAGIERAGQMLESWLFQNRTTGGTGRRHEVAMASKLRSLNLEIAIIGKPFCRRKVLELKTLAYWPSGCNHFSLKARSALIGALQSEPTKLRH